MQRLRVPLAPLTVTQFPSFDGTFKAEQSTKTEEWHAQMIPSMPGEETQGNIQ